MRAATRLRLLVFVAACLLGVACRSSPDPHPELQRVDDAPSPPLHPADPFESPAPPSPVDDIPESERIEFHERNANRVGQRGAGPSRG